MFKALNTLRNADAISVTEMTLCNPGAKFHLETHVHDAHSAWTSKINNA